MMAGYPRFDAGAFCGEDDEERNQDRGIHLKQTWHFGEGMQRLWGLCVRYKMIEGVDSTVDAHAS